MQLDQRRAQLVQQKEDLEASLASQRNVSAQLRDEVAKLTAKLQQVASLFHVFARVSCFSFEMLVLF
jgi:hypothetical protein